MSKIPNYPFKTIVSWYQKQNLLYIIWFGLIIVNSLFVSLLLCACILSSWVRCGTVSRTCVSCRTPSRDSTHVTATADWANWRTCFKTLWYALRFCPTLPFKGFPMINTELLGKTILMLCTSPLTRCLQICGTNRCANPAFGVSIKFLMNT